MENTNDSFTENNLFSSNSNFSSSNGGFFETIKNINWTTWLLIIFILAFLGFNILAYLGQGVQDVTNFTAPLIKTIFGGAVAVTGEVIDVSAEGAKKVVTGTADVLETGLTAIQDITPEGSNSILKGQPINQEQQQQKQQSPDNIALNKALNASAPMQQDYQANEASSSVHSSSGKAGWCFVGVDRGFRTCAEIGANDTCMSGEIFPSREICMNPNLRS